MTCPTIGGAFEGFDNHHGATATQRACLQGNTRECLISISVILADFAGGCGRRHLHELPAQSELLCAVAIGQETEIANTLESVGKNVKQEPTDEFVSTERHRLVAVVIAIILPAKLNLTVIDIEQAIVGDGDAVRVSCDVLEDLFRSGKGALRVNHPILLLGRRDVTQEGVAHPKGFQGGKELQISGVEGLAEIIEKQSTKQTRQHENGQKERAPAGNPSRAIHGNAPTRNHAVQMRMVKKSLAPSVEYREESDLSAKMLGVSRNGAQRLARGPKQNVVDDLLVLKGNGGDGLRQGEDHVKILSVEELGSTVFQPLGARQRLAFWAVAIAAAVVADAPVVTAIAAFDMTTKRRCSTELDRAHDATLCGA